MLHRWRFTAVKALAITNLLELEKQGKITRDDGFQGILDAIAGDVRSKHRKRMQRQHEMKSMKEALRHLQERKKNYEEQISSYQDHVQAAMNTMQQKKGYYLLAHKVIQTDKTTVKFSERSADSLFLLPNNFGMFGSYRRPGSLLNLGRTFTLPRTFMIRRSCYPSSNIHLVNTTNFTLRSRPIPLAYSHSYWSQRCWE